MLAWRSVGINYRQFVDVCKGDISIMDLYDLAWNFVEYIGTLVLKYLIRFGMPYIYT